MGIKRKIKKRDLEREENRKFFRFSCQFTGEVRFGNKNIEKASIKDISHGGVGLSIQNMRFCPDPQVEVRVDLPENDGPLLVSGKIKWSHSDRNRMEMGIELDPIDTETKWKILDHVFAFWREEKEQSKNQ